MKRCSVCELLIVAVDWYIALDNSVVISGRRSVGWFFDLEEQLCELIQSFPIVCIIVKTHQVMISIASSVKPLVCLLGCAYS